MEYKFYVLKYIIDIKEKGKKEFYVKKIQPGKIRETIYCFQKLIEEKEKHNISNSNVIITQEIGQENYMKIILSINKKEKKYAEINLIKLDKRMEVNDVNLRKYETLFLGVKK